MFTEIISFVNFAKPMLEKSHQRRALAFHAARQNDEINIFIQSLPYSRKLIISESLEDALGEKNAATILGEEYDAVVLDLRESFNPDILGMVSGVLCGGGFLFLILAEEIKWDDTNSLFLEHIKGLLTNNPAIIYFHRDENVSDFKDVNSAEYHAYSNSSVYRTNDQKNAVENIISGLLSEKGYCCVLTSGRGRGKSASLGIIAAHLLQKKVVNILLSAPKRSVADPIFENLQVQCPNGERHRAEFSYKASSIKFIAPDLLLDTLPKADVLFVDEAAAIPISMLDNLLLHYPKIIFSTTTHGYEGTGRGFVVKFYQLLNKTKPTWVKHNLHQPIRWAINDPLEKWIENALFLNLKLSEIDGCKKEKKNLQVNLVNRVSLLTEHLKFTSLFSLLACAHYRTRPSDFKYFLDNENVRIYELCDEKIILGVLVINQEGYFDSAMGEAIYRGERRPQGNLLAQTLCFHAGDSRAAGLGYARVMRVAIHPNCQAKGAGSLLLERVTKKEKALGMDVIGASFSATELLLNFWEKNNFSLLRLGFSRDHVSASHSAVMCKALSDKGEVTVKYLASKFDRNISLWLEGPLNGVSEEIKKSVLPVRAIESSDSLTQASLSDMEDVVSYAHYNRNYETCLPAIIRYVNDVSGSLDSLDDENKKIINLSLKYMADWKSIVSKAKCQGKSQADKKLRLAIRQLLDVN